MLTRRVIACLDVHGGRVVKGVQFLDLRQAGDPAELALRHASDGADEIVFLDISATHEERAISLDAVRRTARQIFIPFSAGGGVRTFADAAEILNSGADKVSINSAAVTNPGLITEIAARFGSQAVIVAIDAAAPGQRMAASNPAAIDSGSNEPSGAPLVAEVTVSGGRKRTGKDVLAWAREAESRGAGEILLTSMRRDGTQAGFDCELTNAVSQAVSIPVIASGGAGSPQHFVDVFTRGAADAALAASIFHFGQVPIGDVKSALLAAGIPARWPC